MSRFWVVFAVCVASASVVGAAPDKKAPISPSKDPLPASGSGSGSEPGSGSAEPVEEPPKDMNGVDENPDAPKTPGDDTKVVVVAPPKSPRAGYPIEEVLRPITLPQNMSEVSLAPHFEINDDTRGGYAGGDALRARYGITRQVQIGLTYAFAAIYHDPSKMAGATPGPLGLQSGKAVGLDVTVLITNFLAVRVGVPVYISPVAVSLLIGAPLKFVLSDKLAVGGIDDFLNIKLDKFAPTFYQEYDNALAGFETGVGGNNTQQAAGYLKISGYVEYQQAPKLALLGRAGILQALNGSSGGGAGTGTLSATETFVRAGVQWTPRRWVDLGISIGFDDLAHPGTFGPQGFVAVRI